MDKVEAEKVVAELDVDTRHDLLMYLAEEFGYRVTHEGKDVTYFIATDYRIWERPGRDRPHDQKANS